MAPRPRTSYRFRTTFNAPVGFVFRWCTDYQPTDPRLEGETYRRKVLERTRRKVVYEDLEELPGGWSWARHVVTLEPPDHWRSDSVGNRRDFLLDYRLRALPGGRTELRFLGRRTPTPLGGTNPSRRAFAASMASTWKRFRRQLESEYRRSRRGRSRSPRS